MHKGAVSARTPKLSADGNPSQSLMGLGPNRESTAVETWLHAVSFVGRLGTGHDGTAAAAEMRMEKRGGDCNADLANDQYRRMTSPPAAAAADVASRKTAQCDFSCAFLFPFQFGRCNTYMSVSVTFQLFTF